MSSTIIHEDEFPNQLSSVENRVAQELRHRNSLWHSNYHEAAIYIEEGLNNDKFENHPKKRATLKAVNVHNEPSHDTTHHETTPLVTYKQQEQQPTEDHNNKIEHSTSPSSTTGSPVKRVADTTTTATATSTSRGRISLTGGQYTTIETYILVHNRYFYQLDLAASVLLLLLALFEPPAVDGYELNPTIHAAIEMFALGVIAIELLLKFRWMGPKRFFRHGRTVLKLVVLLTMNVEAITVFLRHSSHARYSRALRPIFLIDNHYCHGIRRAIRQIFQSLPPILDMFTLALFFMFVFSIFGFYLFAANNQYFSDMPTTVGNLLILATTANLPDVMMPSYAVSRWSTMFFVLFIITHLFLLTNLTMAAVYESFTRKEKEKFHKLLLHRRKACQEAFKLLVSRRYPNRIQYRQFMGLMRYLNRKCSMFDAYLIFKAIDTDKNGSISLEEFYQIYDFINLDWKLIYPEIEWYDDCDCLPLGCKYPLSIIKRTVKHRYFEWSIDLLIAAAAALQFIEATTFLTTVADGTPAIADQQIMFGLVPRPDSISTFIFVCLFSLEALLRVLADGFEEYWKHRWNRFDLLVLLISIVGLLGGHLLNVTPFGWVIVLRLLRLMRLFEFKRRYRDIWQTLTYIMMKRFVSMTCVVMILYYFFAILGMELLGEYDLRNCCKNTSLESQFKQDTGAASTDGAKYYLNDFGDLVASYLTLFSMSSNTYWLATMNAYAIVSGSEWVRLFFGVYYLCSIIVMNIVIAFILESFLFRIQYRSKMGNNCDDTNLFTVRVTLSPSEVDFVRKNLHRSHRADKNFKSMQRAIVKEKLMAWSPSDASDSDGERMKLLRNSEQKRERKSSQSKLSGDLYTAAAAAVKNEMTRTSAPAIGSTKNLKRQNRFGDSNEQSEFDSRRWLLVYQAEQLRNKFSFTMKMYADEVEGWLAEAERADQDEMSTMISRNQLRAEHVAMARLVRRNIAAGYDPNLLANWPRGRSYSSSNSEHHQQRTRHKSQADISDLEPK